MALILNCIRIFLTIPTYFSGGAAMAVNRTWQGYTKRYSRNLLHFGLLIGCLITLTMAGAISSNTQINRDTISANTANPTIGQCPIFPADNAWNTDISSYPVHP